MTVKGRVPELNEEGQEPWRKVHNMGIPERGLAFLSVQWKSGFIVLKENCVRTAVRSFFSGNPRRCFLRIKAHDVGRS